MPRKKSVARPPFLVLEMWSKGQRVLYVKSQGTQPPPSLTTAFGATLDLPVGADRLAIATTLVEVARDLVRDDEALCNRINLTSKAMIMLQIASADRFVVQPPDDFPF